MIYDRKRERRAACWFHLLFIILSLTCIIPIVQLVSISLSNESDIVRNGFPFVFARKLDLGAYRFVFKTPATILNAYKSTILVAVVGTVLYVILATLAAYPLSRPNYPFRKAMSIFLLIPMLFSGGTIPYYLLVTQTLHLTDSYWALILHGCVNIWSVFMLRAFMRSLSQDILEAAVIDGASQATIYLRFVIPLSKACIAVIAFNTFLSYWGQWETCLLFIRSPEKYMLQYLLQRMLNNIEAIKKQMEMGLTTYQKMPGETVRMAMCVMTIGPSIFIFPFFQKYFSRGLMLGSVKG